MNQTIRSDDLEGLSGALEGLYAAGDLRLGVPRAQLHPDSRLALGHNWEAKANHEDVLLQHLVGQLGCQPRVAQPHRRNRTVIVSEDPESCGLHAGPEDPGVGVELGDQVLALVQHLVGLQGSAHNWRSDRVGEEVGTRPVPQRVHHLAGGGHESARCASHGLAKSRADEVYLAVEAEQLRRAFAGLPDESSSVALVHIDVRVVLLGQLVDLVERSDVPVHREHSVSDDHPHSRCLELLELLLEVGHVQVLEASLLRLAEADTVDDGGVVEGVTDDRVLGPEDSLEEARVGIEAAGEEDGVLERVVVRDDSLQLLVNVLGAADETHRTHAEPVRLQSPNGGLFETSIVGEAEVVVGAEVEDSLAVGVDFRELGRGDDALGLVGACVAHGLQLLGEVLLDELGDPAHDCNQDIMLVKVLQL